MVSSSFGDGKAAWLRRLEWVLGFAAVGIVLLAYFQKFSPADFQKFEPFIRDKLVWVSDEAWWMILSLTTVGAIAKVAKQRLESAWIWSAVKAIIDRIAKDAFKGVDGPQHYHRATLFRHCRYKWWLSPRRHPLWPWGFQGRRRMPCSGWLIPVIRSGGMTQKTSTVFLAPDDADHAEGVAGYVWSMRGEGATVTVTAAQAPLDSNASNSDIQQYAKNTRTSEDWVRKQLGAQKVLSASFSGIPIEVKGQTWGVLILDSRDPQAGSQAQINMAQHAFVLGKLLERV